MVILRYPPFLAVEAIRNAAKSSPSLRRGSKGPGVYVLQAALIDLGYKMPISTKKTGFPDGDYGGETEKVIIEVQKAAKLTLIDGVAGKDTIAALDKRMMTKFPKVSVKIPPTTPIPSAPSSKEYKLGAGNPVIKPDPGAGGFNSVPTTASTWALKQSILEILPPRGTSAAVIIGIDAAMHMKHYLNASGSRYSIRLENMIESGPTATARFKDEVNQAKKFVETLSAGTHKITSITAESAYNYKDESWNWFYAVGGYATWGKGVARVTESKSGKQCELDFEYHFFDRYNWDKGKSVKIGPITITDEFMGDFHRQGLAKEFDMTGMITRKFSWKQGQSIPDVQYKKSGGR